MNDIEKLLETFFGEQLEGNTYDETQSLYKKFAKAIKVNESQNDEARIITELEKIKDKLLDKNVGGVKGKTWGDTKYDSPSVAYGYNLALMDVHANISNEILEYKK